MTLASPAEAQFAASRKALAEHGNCSSATVLLVLQELADADGPGAAMAFGPGLTLYAARLLPTCPRPRGAPFGRRRTPTRPRQLPRRDRFSALT